MGTQPTAQQFKQFLGNIFQSVVGQEIPVLEELSAVACSGGLHDIPPFSFDESQQVLRQLKMRKTPDANGLVAEMFKFGGEVLPKCLLKIFTSMLHSGNFPPIWRDTLFMMLPKAGDNARPNNWRLVAILNITYHDIFQTVT